MLLARFDLFFDGHLGSTIDPRVKYPSLKHSMHSFIQSLHPKVPKIVHLSSKMSPLNSCPQKIDAICINVSEK